MAIGVPDANGKITLLLYDGTGTLLEMTGYKDGSSYSPTYTASTGGITYSNDTGEVTVTGDGTLSITWTQSGGGSA